MSNRKSLRVIDLRVLVGVFGILGASAAFAQAPAAEVDACGPRKISKKVDKPMSAVEKAFQNKQWDEVLAKVAEAEAVPVDKSLYDQFWFNEFRGRAYLNQQKYPEAAKELEAGLASPCMDEKEKPARLKMLLQIAYQTKDYAKVISLGNQYLEKTPDPDIGAYVGNAYYATDDFPNTKKVMTDVVAKQEASGKTPDELTYRILQGACIKLKDNACVAEMLEKLATHYSKPTYWQDLMAVLMATTKNNNQLLNMWRLADEMKVLSDPAEYLEMAQLAIGQGLPGEAQTILEKGVQKGVFTSARQKEQSNAMLAEAKQAVALDKSTLEKQDVAARAKPTGDNDVKLGAAYLSYGQIDKAVEALNRGIAKGGVKNPDEAAILLGIAHLRAGNKPEAAKAFSTANKDATMTRIAKLWLVST
ncbi:MAG TPA: tetratricopeptide repeat protein [Steroidobacteraceae bacterium]|nr:tetratricopeptide repeat protein [Steroidobacteraceae bacterium]